MIDENTIKEEKDRIRSEIKARFKEESNLEIVRNVHSLQEDVTYCERFLRKVSSYKDAKTVFGYVSMDAEFPTLPLLVQIVKDGKTLAIPRVDGKNLQFCQVHTKDSTLFPLQKGAFGIMEPTKDAPVLFPQTAEKLQELSPIIVLVPGRAFSLSGGRMGYGGGFYDRFFASLFSACERSTISLVGLCFSFQILPQLPMGKYDVFLDKILSE